jgi:dimethylhistidine N-methyltransferase
MTDRIRDDAGVRRAAARAAANDRQRLAPDVQYYLTLSPRQLPSRYLYDALGSSLFVAISHLPWYAVTRAEGRLLGRHGQDIVARSGPASIVVELGSGGGEKLHTLLDTPARAGTTVAHLIDVSPSALDSAVRALSDLAGVSVVIHEAEYEDGLDGFARARRTGGRALALFLGSNIGNFDRPGAEALLTCLRGALRARDWLLLGADLVKPAPELLLAYADPLGVTAAFNRNLLVRLNTELDADFDLECFAHRAVWNETESRVEMHLVSTCAQRVRIAGAGMEIELAEGESIWTESSYKYRPDEIVSLVERAGFACRTQWIDPDDPFALSLFEAV